MNLDQLHYKLIETARTASPSDAVPYGFEKRIMARLKAGAAPDYWALWSRVLWRAAAPCVAVVLLLSAWTFLESNGNGSSETLGVELENTVMAALNNLGESW